MTINNVEFDIDFTDADFIEKYDFAYEKLVKQSEELETKELTPAEGIRQECKIVKDFLDYVLGEGTSQILFGEKNSLNQCIKALEDIKMIKDNQELELVNKLSEYSPDRLKR